MKKKAIVLNKLDTNEVYCFIFNLAHREDVLRTFGRFATNKDLSFTWYDAAVLTGRVNRLFNTNDRNNRHIPR